MEISKNLQAVIEQMVDELNANLPPDSEPQTTKEWIGTTLKSGLADYYGRKIRVEKEPELAQVRKLAQEKEWETQNLIVTKRKEIFELSDS